MAKKRGTQLPALTPERWIRALRTLGITAVRVQGSHHIYEIPGYPELYSGQPYVVDTNWPVIARQHIRLVLRLLGKTVDDLWDAL